MGNITAIGEEKALGRTELSPGELILSPILMLNEMLPNRFGMITCAFKNFQILIKENV